MNTYFILHPINGKMNNTGTTLGIAYQCIGSVEAESLNGAFMYAQNDFNADYREFDVRSTSVGDIILDNDYNFNFVKGMGFERVNDILIDTDVPTEEDYWHGDESDNFLQ